jgi:hypothetical protein
VSQIACQWVAGSYILILRFPLEEPARGGVVRQGMWTLELLRMNCRTGIVTVIGVEGAEWCRGSS